MKHILQIVILFGLTANALPADIVYNVAVNTSAYLGRFGYLDFQLGSGPDSTLASVAVQNFSTDGVLNDTDKQMSGDVTGVLPEIITLTNRQQFNDYFVGFTYGKLIAFTLGFSGPAINESTSTAAYGSPFYFGLYDSAQAPIGSSDAFGSALLIQINADGTTTPQIYNNAVSATTVAVPEPGALGLLGVGLAIAAKAVRARGQSRHHRQLI